MLQTLSLNLKKGCFYVKKVVLYYKIIKEVLGICYVLRFKKKSKTSLRTQKKTLVVKHTNLKLHFRDSMSDV